MRIYEAEKSIDVPIDFNLTQLLNTSARRPDRSASPTIAKDNIEARTLTLEQLRDYSGRIARGLKNAFSPRDQSRWAVILPNSVAYLEACHAVLWLGGVFCPINHLLTSHEIGNALSICQPQYIIAYEETVPRLLRAIQLARTQNLSYGTPEIILGIGRSREYPSLHTFLASSRLEVPHFDNTRRRLASIHLSSGTTGNSKGVGLSHYNYVANVLQMWEHDRERWSPAEQMVSFTPFVHIANTTIPLFLGPWTGMLHIIMGRFELQTLCKLVQDNQATAMQCTPAIAVAIADTDLTRKYDLSSIKHMVVGGLPLTKEIYDRFLSKGPWKTIQLYGMTEAAPYVTWQKMSET